MVKVSPVESIGCVRFAVRSCKQLRTLFDNREVCFLAVVFAISLANQSLIPVVITQTCIYPCEPKTAN